MSPGACRVATSSVGATVNCFANPSTLSAPTPTAPILSNHSRRERRDMCVLCGCGGMASHASRATHHAPRITRHASRATELKRGKFRAATLAVPLRRVVHRPALVTLERLVTLRAPGLRLQLDRVLLGHIRGER